MFATRCGFRVNIWWHLYGIVGEVFCFKELSLQKKHMLAHVFTIANSLTLNLTPPKSPPKSNQDVVRHARDDNQIGRACPTPGHQTNATPRPQSVITAERAVP